MKLEPHYYYYSAFGRNYFIGFDVVHNQHYHVVREHNELLTYRNGRIIIREDNFLIEPWSTNGFMGKVLIPITKHHTNWIISRDDQTLVLESFQELSDLIPIQVKYSVFLRDLEKAGPIVLGPNKKIKTGRVTLSLDQKTSFGFEEKKLHENEAREKCLLCEVLLKMKFNALPH